MEPQDQTIHQDPENKENAVLSPSLPPEVTSTTRAQIGEVVIEPLAHEVDHELLDARGETGVDVNDATSASTPPVNNTHAPDIVNAQQEDESSGITPRQQEDHVDVVEEDITAIEHWDPLRSSARDTTTEKDSRALDLVQGVLEDDIAVHPHGQDILIRAEKGDDMLRVQSPTMATTRRVSNLHLDLTSALPSSQPWDTDGPLNSLTRGKMEYPESGSVSRSQFPTHSRPLKPKSSYYFGPPLEDSAFGTAPVGQIGVHFPREMVRIERDYSGGELPQFAAIYPLEFEGRISPTQFLESINSMNEILISAHSLRHSLADNALAIFSLQLSKLVLRTHYQKEMERLHEKIRELNESLFNPVGLNILWPRKVAFLFVGISSPFWSSSGLLTD